jgi:hypothetical protein
MTARKVDDSCLKPYPKHHPLLQITAGVATFARQIAFSLRLIAPTSLITDRATALIAT